MFNLFDLTLKINGFPMKEAQLEFEKNLQISESEYQKFIETKRKEIVQFHIENNPFYKKLVGNSDSSNWNNLPILTKKNLQVPLQQRAEVTLTSPRNPEGRAPQAREAERREPRDDRVRVFLLSATQPASCRTRRRAPPVLSRTTWTTVWLSKLGLA